MLHDSGRETLVLPVAGCGKETGKCMSMKNGGKLSIIEEKRAYLELLVFIVMQKRS
jgi:hypothetical protein